MGDIGGTAQAAASVVDTGMNDATNMAMQQISNNFNAEQANLGRVFAGQQQASAQKFSAQEQLQAEQYNTQMSDTAMQRRVADLKAAGLNPLLGMGALGGASSPVMSAPSSPAIGGPSASSVGLPNLQPLTQGLQGTLTAIKQRQLLDAQTQKTTADAKTTNAELPWAAASAEAGYNNLVATRENLMAQVKQLASQFDYNEANASQLWQNQDFREQLQPLVVRAAELENQAKQFGLPSLAVQSAFWSSPLAQAFYAGQQGHGVSGDVGGALAFAAATPKTLKSTANRGSYTEQMAQALGEQQ